MKNRKSIIVKSKNLLESREAILSKDIHLIEIYRTDLSLSIYTIDAIGNRLEYEFPLKDLSVFELLVEDIETKLKNSKKFINVDSAHGKFWVRMTDSLKINLCLSIIGVYEREITISIAGWDIISINAKSNKNDIKTVKKLLSNRPDLVKKLEDLMIEAQKANDSISKVIRSLK